MTIHDSLGLPLSGATAGSLDAYEEAVRGFQRFGGDPLASADTAITAAIRSGDREKAGALAAGRLAARPDSPLARLFSARAQAISSKGSSKG